MRGACNERTLLASRTRKTQEAAQASVLLRRRAASCISPSIANTERIVRATGLPSMSARPAPCAWPWESWRTPPARTASEPPLTLAPPPPPAPPSTPWLCSGAAATAGASRSAQRLSSAATPRRAEEELALEPCCGSAADASNTLSRSGSALQSTALCREAGAGEGRKRAAPGLRASGATSGGRPPLNGVRQAMEGAALVFNVALWPKILFSNRQINLDGALPGASRDQD